MLKFNKLRNIISSASQKSKYFEKDFFPSKLLNSKQGRFELLALSILDVRGFDADKLWYIVGKQLRYNNVLRIENLLNISVAKLTRELRNAGYYRGEKYTPYFAKSLRKLAHVVKTKYNSDISQIFYNNKIHNKNSVLSILSELDLLPGVGLKIATMYLKFMISTFKVWKWKNKMSLIGIAIPDDFQVRKVFLRLGNNRTKDITKQYSSFSSKLKLTFMEIDDVLWNVGRIFCSKKSPSCHYCLFGAVCNYANLRRLGKTELMEKLDEQIN